MKQVIITLLIKLYPTAWQQRYGEEYLALLQELPFTWQSGLDILQGVLDAHLHPEWADLGRLPMNQKRGFRIAGSGAILSALLLVLGMLSNSRLTESEAEFLLLLAPIALFPLVIVLHWLYRSIMPRASLVTAVIGISSMGTFLIAVIIGAIAEMLNASIQPLSFAWIFQIMIALIGIWIILAAYLGWQTHTLPSGLPAMMATSGFGWSIMFVGVILNSQGNPQLFRFSAIMGAGFALWLMTHFIWTIWFAFWFWQQSQIDKFTTTSELVQN